MYLPFIIATVKFCIDRKCFYSCYVL